MLVNGMGCYYPGWGGSKRDEVVVNGMGCYFPGWGVIICDCDGVLVNGIEC